MDKHPTITTDEAHQALAALTAALSNRTLRNSTRAEYLHFLRATEATIRELQGLQYNALADMETTIDSTIGWQPVREAVADALHITPNDAKARLTTAEKITPRHSLAGESLPPLWDNTAKLVSAGLIGTAHLDVIKDFFKHLPRKTDPITVDFAEAQLAQFAAQFRPDELATLAKTLLAGLNPDGTLDDEKDRARKRHFTMRPQGTDKMTTGTFCLDPSTAAAIEALLAKFARPGMCNPADPDPTIDTEPSDTAISTDDRTYGQRCHDAITMIARNTLTDEKIGHHRGLPATIIITADIKDLDPDLGGRQLGRTGGGLTIPINDILRIGRHARHYLAILDHGKPVSLHHGRSQRLASPGQRLMLHASERGCTFPNCHRGAYYSQVHHTNDWALGGNTNIDEETLACEIHHPVVGPEPHKWKTRKTRFGLTEWIPPTAAYPNRKPGTNYFHFPERRL